MSLFEPKNLLTGLFAIVAFGWAGYAVFVHGRSDEAAAAPIAPSTFALKPSRTLELRALLVGGKIDELERLLTGLQDDFEAGKIDERKVSDAFGAFATSDPALKGPLDRWRRERPNSFAPALASARYHLYLAFEARGEEVAAKTPPERFEAMRTHMRRARSDAIRAHDLRPHLIAAAPTMITVGFHLQDYDEMRDRVLALGRQYPCSELLHWPALRYLHPRWGGSLRKVDQYASTVSAECPKLRGMRAYGEIVQGDLAKWSGNNNAAIRHYSAAIRLVDRAPGYYYLRGMVYRSLNERDKAFADFGRTFELNPEHKSALTEIAVTLFQRGRTKEALRLWERALALQPYDPEVLIDRAVNLIRSDDNPAAWYEMAIADLEKAKRYGSDLARINRYQRTAQMRRISLTDGIAILRQRYYADPLNEEAFALYQSSLSSRFTCARTDEYRALLAHCAKTGRCNRSAVHIYGLELESKVNRHQCQAKERPAQAQNPR